MADNTKQKADEDIATDDIGGVKYVRGKITLGADGVNDGDVSATNPLPAGIYAFDGTSLRLLGCTTSGELLATIGSSALPTGAATETTLAAASTSLAVLDDWDESDRAKVNAIVGQAGVAGGAGGVTANTQRVAIATDAPLPVGGNKIGAVSLIDSSGFGSVDVTANALHAMTCDGSGSPWSSGNPLPVTSPNATIATRTSVPDSATAVELLGVNASRRGVMITNDSSADLYIGLGSNPTTADYSFVLEGKPTGKPAGGVWEPNFPVHCAINGIWASDPNDGAARITELTS